MGNEETFKTKKIVTQKEVNEFMVMVITFVEENKWTASNIREGIESVNKVMIDNAVLEKTSQAINAD